MSSTELSEAAREARNEYARNWRKKNPDKEKAHHVKYWERKAREMAAEKEAENNE